MYPDTYKLIMQALTFALLFGFALMARADDDAERLAQYRLNTATFKKMELALTNLAAVVQADPTLAQDPENEDDMDTIAAMSAFYNARPPLRAAIERSGLSVDAFSLCLMAWVQASIAHGFSEHLPPESRAKMLADSGVPAANVEFVKANKDYLKRLEPKLKALSQG